MTVNSQETRSTTIATTKKATTEQNQQLQQQQQENNKKKSQLRRVRRSALDAMRSHDRPGAVSVPNHNVDAQQSHHHLQYFSQPTAKPNMVVKSKK